MGHLLTSLQKCLKSYPTRSDNLRLATKPTVRLSGWCTDNNIINLIIVAPFNCSIVDFC